MCVLYIYRFAYTYVSVHMAIVFISHGAPPTAAAVELNVALLSGREERISISRDACVTDVLYAAELALGTGSGSKKSQRQGKSGFCSGKKDSQCFVAHLVPRVHCSKSAAPERSA